MWGTIPLQLPTSMFSVIWFIRHLVIFRSSKKACEHILIRQSERIVRLHERETEAWGRGQWRSYLQHLHIGQLKQGLWMMASRVNQPCVDLWPCPNRIFEAAVHKSQAELLTVSRPCQDAQLIQRLLSGHMILGIQTGGPDSPYTPVNGCICQGGFVALAAMRARSVIYWRRRIIGFCTPPPPHRFLQSQCFQADLFFSWALSLVCTHCYLTS